ncbi:hypothetical protein DPMN_192164 [Dreissena polymorpha]|uniref:Tetratricopeptide repeat protein n=1 Tax=Dreissena polymorpha TaxID=45954 RepID=A0A9D3XYJ5_DREPO|nr:hypothetical protein DPMN_192164 [Dreissena polymorpha]
MRYHSKVKAVCGCFQREDHDHLHVFDNMMSGDSVNGFIELPFAFCVRFLRKESYCTPSILLFEMIRNITEEEVAQRTGSDIEWMDSAEVDARPFLHYLQYLTYEGLGERDNKLHALRVLESYLCNRSNYVNLYQLETAGNLLGHCYEMEGDYERALHYYR